MLQQRGKYTNSVVRLRRVLCCVLSFALFFSLSGTSAFADEIAEAVNPSSDTAQTVDIVPASEQEETLVDPPSQPFSDDEQTEIIENGTQLVPAEEIVPAGDDGEDITNAPDQGAYLFSYSAALVKESGNSQKDVAEIGDTIVYTIELSEVTQSNFDSMTVSSAMLGWGASVSLSAAGASYDALLRTVTLSKSYVVTEADVASGDPIGNVLMLFGRWHGWDGPWEGEMPTFFEEIPTKAAEKDLASYSVSLEGEYGEGVIDYVVTIANTGMQDISGMQLVFSATVIDGMHIDNMADALSFIASEEDDSFDPNNIFLAAGQSITIHAALTPPYDENNYEQVVACTAIAKVGEQKEEASCNVNAFHTFTSKYLIETTMRLINGSTEVEREEGSFAVPGDSVEYTFTFKNSGETIFDSVSAKPDTDGLIPEKDWEVVEEVLPQDEISFVATYRVSEDDVVVLEDGEMGALKAGVLFAIDGEEVPYSIESFKVVNEYDYTITYWLDRGDESKPEVLDQVEGSAPFGTKLNLKEGPERGMLGYMCPMGYEGSYDKVVVSSDVESNNVDVVYAPADFEYTVYYYVDNSFDASNRLPETHTGKAPFGSEFTLSLKEMNLHRLDGFIEKTEDERPAITIQTEGNVFEVVYERDSFDYVINYYVDDDDAEPVAQLPGKALYGTTVTVGQGMDEGQLNYRLPAGYVPLTEDLNFTVGASADDNVFKVVYDQKRSDLSYTIKYYAGSTDTEPLRTLYVPGAGTLGESVTVGPEVLNLALPSEGYLPKAEEQSIVISADENTNVLEVVYEPITFDYHVDYYLDSVSEDNFWGFDSGRAPYGSTVSLDDDALNKYLPSEGYMPKTSDDENSFVITADPSGTVFNVIYKRASYAYTVNFYTADDDDFDNPNPANPIHSDRFTAEYGKPVIVTSGYLNKYCPDGYQTIEGNRQLTSISANEAANVINVVFAKRTDLAYTVNYYLDEVGGELVKTSTGTGTLGAPIPYENGLEHYAGYSDQVVLSDADPRITAKGSDNVLNVVYVKATVGYTVNYYKDSRSEDNFLGSVTGEGEYLSDVLYELGPYVPEGYAYDESDVEVTGAKTIGADAESNVLNIVYTKQKGIAYTVNYYGGSVDGRFLGSYAGTGTFGDSIEYVEGNYLVLGYGLPAELDGETTIGADAASNVLNVVYPALDYAYTVNYYQDSVNGTLLGTDAGVAPYESAIPYDMGAYVPTGYDADGVLSGNTTISFDEGANVLNVIYTPARFAFTVNYYRGSVDSRNLIASQTQDPRMFGSKVQLTAEELNLQVPEGYTPLTQGASLDITDDPAQNVVSVVFYPNFNDFYAAGVVSLSATYDGAKHYLTTRGVIDGDIITYTYNGAVQTRVVGRDSNIAAEFEDVTDGDMPVLVTVTRGGITSNAIQTTVNIASNAEDPAQEQVTQDQNAPSSLLQPTVLTLGPSLISEAFDAIDDAFAAEPGLTIDDDANPLAAFPTTSSDDPSGSQGVGFLLLAFSLITLLGFAGLMLWCMRLKRTINQIGSDAAILERYRLRNISRAALCVALAAAVLFALWLVFLI